MLDVDPRGKFTVKVVNDSLNIFKAKAKLEFPNSDEFRRVIIGEINHWDLLFSLAGSNQ